MNDIQKKFACKHLAFTMIAVANDLVIECLHFTRDKMRHASGAPSELVFQSKY